MKVSGPSPETCASWIRCFNLGRGTFAHTIAFDYLYGNICYACSKSPRVELLLVFRADPNIPCIYLQYRTGGFLLLSREIVLSRWHPISAICYLRWQWPARQAFLRRIYTRHDAWVSVSALLSNYAAMPMTPQAGRAPALPVFLLSSVPPRPRSSVPAWVTMVRCSESILSVYLVLFYSPRKGSFSVA